VKIASFSVRGSTDVRLGVLAGEGALADLADAAGDEEWARDILAFLRSGEEGLALARECARAPRRLLPLGEVRLLAPLTAPGKILAVGLNYAEHREEVSSAAPRPPYPEGFVKLASTIVGPEDPVVAWPDVRQMDYEGELAVVVGAVAHNVSLEEALGYVAGYTIANDVSARDWQASERRRGRSPLMGKNFPTFCPLGPWLVTRDEIPDPQELSLSLRVNGELRQHATTAEMLFPVREILAHWSKLRLLPGDVILTGTPAGVALGRPDPEPFWLRPGDLVEVEIERIGVLRNPVVAAAASP
jgi:2-keto-4-pentenoate hydratase/2-oxohepta-3-ene-1,7-dioic acid hydratase in catechol pathway